MLCLSQLIGIRPQPVTDRRAIKFPYRELMRSHIDSAYHNKPSSVTKIWQRTGFSWTLMFRRCLRHRLAQPRCHGPRAHCHADHETLPVTALGYDIGRSSPWSRNCFCANWSTRSASARRKRSQELLRRVDDLLAKCH